MRITCPRCSAHYEVPDSVMPPGGRDVQCSHCGHSWYQLVATPAAEAPATAPPAGPEAPHSAVHADDPQETESETRLRRLREALDGHKARRGTRPAARSLNLTGQRPSTEPAPDSPVTETAATVTRDPDPAPSKAPSQAPSSVPSPDLSSGSAPSAASAPDTEQTGSAEDLAGDEPTDAFVTRRELDPAVAAVLRAEAEFERNARAHGPAQALEMQPELGLAPPERRGQRSPGSVRDRLARLQEAERSAEPVLPGGEETFPDPAGLGYTLTPAAPDPDRPRPPPPPPAPVVFTKAGLPVCAAPRELAAIESARARTEFRWGFLLALGACLLLPAVYLSAPALADLLPSQSSLFESVARRGADIHLALAGAVQETLTTLGGWLRTLASPPA